LHSRLAGASSGNQPAHFISGECSPLVPHIHFAVQPLQAQERIPQQPLGRHAPVQKPVERLQVVVVRPVANVIRLPKAAQVGLNRLRLKIGQPSKSTTTDDGTDLIHRSPNVPRCVVRQAAFVSGQVSIERRELLIEVPLLLWVDHSRRTQAGFRFQLGGQLFAQPLIGEPLGRATATLMVPVLNRIDGVLSPFVPLEDRRHFSVLLIRHSLPADTPARSIA
jgi:hypothetical protein